MPALAPVLSPLEVGFWVDIVLGPEAVDVVLVLDEPDAAVVVDVVLLLDESNVAEVGALEEDDEAEDAALPSCCVTVPSCVMKNPLPAAQQPWLPPTLSAHQLPSVHAVSATSVPLSVE